MKFLLLLIALVQFSCCDGISQETNDSEVYISHGQPFEIPATEKSIHIPDSIKPINFQEGILVISYFVDANGFVDGTNLRLLRMKDINGDQLVSYYNESMRPERKDYYPKEIQQFLPWVYSYAKTRDIVRKRVVENDLKWVISVMVRLE